MAIIVVGGHTRNIGKTSVVTGLIAALPHHHWTAIKITQFGHGICSANGKPCDCETADHTLAISEERDPTSKTDTGRYLAAGAARSIWIRTQQGHLAAAMPRIRQLLASSENAIVESNSILRFLQPDLSLTVLDPSVADFKPSALHYLDRVDALIVPEGADLTQTWNGVSLHLLQHKCMFKFRPPTYCPPDLAAFVQIRIADARPKEPTIGGCIEGTSKSLL